jgi:alanine-glyoxylate transaminase / serine-glyoxylate transaminase / serine-pyruvate transaminase
MPALVAEIRAGLRRVFNSEQGEPVIFPGSGTGAWEASLVNTLSPGERVLSFDNGHFARLYAEAARQLGMQVDEIKLHWGDAVTESDVEGNLKAEHRAVLIVHNETSTGVTTDMAAVRRGIDRTGHDPLLLVDVVSSLGSIDVRMDEWRVDVALTGTQKGLMLPPGGAILCVGPRALDAASKNRTPRYFYDWRPVIRDMQQGFFPYTPATLLLFGLREALRMLFEEGLDKVLARHSRLAEGARQAVHAWGLGLLARDRARASNSLTAVVVDKVDSNTVVKVAADRLNLALGIGLGQLRGTVFRIGHLGSLNEMEVLATLAGTELALHYSGQPIELGAGVAAAQRFFAGVRPDAGRAFAPARAATPERVT